MQLMVHGSRCLEARQLGVGELTGRMVEQYLAERRAAGYTEYVHVSAWRRYLRHWPLTVRVLRIWLTEHAGTPLELLFSTSTGTHRSRDAIEHRIAR